MERLRVLFMRMRVNGLKLKPINCNFVKESVHYLRHLINASGIRPVRDRDATIRHFPETTNLKTLGGFLGFCGFYRRFIQNFAKIASPLTDLLKKEVPFVWDDVQKQAFDILDILLHPPILTHYDQNIELDLRTDACVQGLGAHLVQITGKSKGLQAC